MPMKSKPKKNKPKKTTAIVMAEKQPIVSVAPSIERAVGRIEQVRRFVQRMLNREQQAFLNKNPNPPKDERGRRDYNTKLKELEVDYGTIPGSKKKSLWQPGAEKICLWLRVRPAYVNYHEERLDYGHLEASVACNLHSVETGELVFSGPICSCSTMESNYRYRFEELDPKTPPPSQDEKKTLKRIGMGRASKRMDWDLKPPQEVWVWLQRVENPNIHDTHNTVRQQAHKRSLVKVVRNFGAMSEIFTDPPSEWTFEDAEYVTVADDEKQYTRGGREIVVAEEQGSQAAADAVARRKVEEAITKAGPVNLRYDKGGKLAYLCGNRLVIEEASKICFIMYLDAQNEWGVEVSDLPKLQAICEQHKIKLEVVSQPPDAPRRPQEAPSAPKDPKTGNDKPPTGKTAPIAKSASDVPSKTAQGRTQASPDMRAKLPDPKDLEAPSPSPKRDGGAQAASVSEGVDMGTRPSEDHALLAPGKLESAHLTKTKTQGIPILALVWKGIHLTCFKKPLWEPLIEGAGKEAELVLSENKLNVIGIRRIGDRRFDEEGLPEIQMGEDRPKTTAGLFE